MTRTRDNAVACIGAGNVGRAWAIVFARSGLNVRLFDTSAESLNDAVDKLKGSATDLEAAGQIDSAKALIARVQPTTELSAAVNGVSYVQESIPERLPLKQAVFAELDATCPPDVLLASSTSELLPSSFLQVPLHPERCLVAHPVNPPYLIPLVELCPAPQTSEVTIARVESLLTQCAMVCIRLKKEISGFLLNRLQAAVLGEAYHLISEGYCSSDDIDRVMTDGLARRWSFIGPLMTGHLNASHGYQQYIELLGSTWEALIDSMRTRTDMSDELISQIVTDMCARIPVDRISAAQAWRDRRLMALADHLANQDTLTKFAAK
ncbi:MAG: 3-hydroxyacyl-CoA dehydrogenase [Pseudomonadota bacterium]